MSKLLSDKWDNAYLMEAFHEALIYNRRQSHSDDEQNKLAVFLRETPIFLFDNPKLDKFNSDVLGVDTGNRKIVFISKDALVNELNQHELPEVKDVFTKVSEFVAKVSHDVKNDINHVSIPAAEFSTYLRNNGLENVADALQLDKPRNTLRM